jgi:hypothetical protein
MLISWLVDNSSANKCLEILSMISFMLLQISNAKSNSNHALCKDIIISHMWNSSPACNPPCTTPVHGSVRGLTRTQQWVSQLTLQEKLNCGEKWLIYARPNEFAAYSGIRIYFANKSEPNNFREKTKFGEKVIYICTANTKQWIVSIFRIQKKNHENKYDQIGL